MARPPRLLLPVLALFACDGGPAAAVPKPPPLPPFPAARARPADEAVAPPVEPAQQALSHQPHGTREPPVRGAKQVHAAEPKDKASTAKAALALKSKGALTAPEKPAAPAAQPAPIMATTPKQEVASKVSVPKTAHLAIDIPSGLQADLNHDPRMQPWVNQVVATIDRCYGGESKSNAKLAGTIEVLVTMHENERPDADIKQLPPALSPIVACATGGLMRTKMPLFTGKEGTRYPVKIRFSP
jgi:hypothetical protein